MQPNHVSHGQRATARLFGSTESWSLSDKLDDLAVAVLDRSRRCSAADSRRVHDLLLHGLSVDLGVGSGVAAGDLGSATDDLGDGRRR